MIRRFKRDKEEERVESITGLYKSVDRVKSITGLYKLVDTIEKRIKDTLVEVAISSSGLEKLKEKDELKIKRIRREKPKKCEDLIKKHLRESEECDVEIKKLKEGEEDLKSCLEEITALKKSLKRKEVIYYMDDYYMDERIEDIIDIKDDIIDIIEQVESRRKEIKRWIDYP